MNLISHLLPRIASGVDDVVEEKLCLPPKIETEGQDTVILYLFSFLKCELTLTAYQGSISGSVRVATLSHLKIGTTLFSKSTGTPKLVAHVDDECVHIV